jgi:Mrp family chromosome partitioning ATPase
MPETSTTNAAVHAVDTKRQHVIAIMSSKGGVGKSLVTSLLAISLQRRGLQVGILDGDITCPGIADMFSPQGQLSLTSRGSIEPMTSRNGIKIMSMAMFSEDESDPLVWRGPMVSSAFKQFYSEVDWGELDYLLVDVPAGTSDVPMTVLQFLPLDGVLIVSSPQRNVIKVVKKCITMVHQFKVAIIGVVENMAFNVDSRKELSESLCFGSSFAELSAEAEAPLLAQLPFDPKLSAMCDAGQIDEYRVEALDTLATNFLHAVEMKHQLA